MKSGRKSLPSISGRKSLKRKSTAASKEVEQTAADSILRMLIRLWSHETTRVYLDRNIDSKERMWFLKLLESCIKYCFCGISFEENSGSTEERGSYRPSGGHTANLGKLVYHKIHSVMHGKVGSQNHYYNTIYFNTPSKF